MGPNSPAARPCFVCDVPIWSFDSQLAVVGNKKILGMALIIYRKKILVLQKAQREK